MMVQSDKFYNIIQLQIHKQKGIKRHITHILKTQPFWVLTEQNNESSIKNNLINQTH